MGVLIDFKLDILSVVRVFVMKRWGYKFLLFEISIEGCFFLKKNFKVSRLFFFVVLVFFILRWYWNGG